MLIPIFNPFSSSIDMVSMESEADKIAASKRNSGHWATAITNFTNATTTLTADSGLVLTPNAGTYVVFLSAAWSTTGTNLEASIQAYKDGVAIPDSLRPIRLTTTLAGGVVSLTANNMASAMNIITPCTFDGSQILTIRTKVVTGTGSITLGPRSLSLLQIGI